MYATRDDFFAAPARRYRDVEVGGLKFRIRSLTEGEWADLQLANFNLDTGERDWDAWKLSDPRLIVASVVNEKDEPVFTDTDVARLAHADAGLTEPLVRAIRAHCALMSVEDAKKNSSTTGDDGSPCSSSEPREQPATTA